MKKKPIAIVGAGLAGLTAANFLKRNNVSFVLYEAGKKMAGFATSFKDPEGFSYDFGAHFITNRLATAIGVSSECRLVKHYGETIWINGHVHTYPFGLIKIPRMTLSWVAGHMNLMQNKNAPVSAAEWFRRRFGSVLADEIALPLIEAWSGVPAEQLSPAVGEGMFGGGSVAKTLYLKTAGIITGRAVACGYNWEKPETPNVWHVYPKNGVSTLCEKLAEGLENSIKLESPVEAIIVENEKVVAVRVKGEIQEVSAVISTAPVNILSKMVVGSNALNNTINFWYRPMVFVNMKFTGNEIVA